MKTLNIAEARSKFSALIDEIRLGGEDVVISKPDSRVTVAVVATDEELAIAIDTYKIVSQLG